MRAWVVASWSFAFVLGWLVGWGCAVDPIFPLVVFRCDPSATATARCPEGYSCCSDDPASFGGPGAEPLFSRARNDASRSGMCVRVDDIAGQGLDEPRDCPEPCNPTWDDERIDTVCGEMGRRVCCQTVEVHEDDCVLDEVEGRWRPADGRDALASLDGGRGWVPTADSTHQDPDFSECERFAGDRSSERFRGCVAELTTAKQRGYCMALDAGEACPADEHLDACEAMN